MSRDVKILAISGGIDSMVMLDIFKNDKNAVVAHFNHGIRKSAKQDELFVESIAKRYGLKFFSGSTNLGKVASEEKARNARYDFLFKLKDELGGEIFVAQHVDDLIESVAINILRGTGWRGLAVMNRAGIRRPFLENKNEMIDKKWIYKYAYLNNLSWRLDSTNNEDFYLRNRIRVAIFKKNDKKKIFELVKRQIEIGEDVRKTFLENGSGDLIERSWFRKLDDDISYEWLRFLTEQAGEKYKSEDIVKLLDAVKNYESGKFVNLSKNRLIKIHKNYFRLR